MAREAPGSARGHRLGQRGLSPPGGSAGIQHWNSGQVPRGRGGGNRRILVETGGGDAPESTAEVGIGCRSIAYKYRGMNLKASEPMTSSPLTRL